MIGTTSCKRWVWSTALLLLLGCKPIPPAVEAFVPRELLDPGEPPRAPVPPQNLVERTIVDVSALRGKLADADD